MVGTGVIGAGTIFAGLACTTGDVFARIGFAFALFATLAVSTFRTILDTGPVSRATR